jgi:hypothetical protein
LGECYGDSFPNIKSYNNLLQKTTNSHSEAIMKHMQIFRNFCLKNEICILNKNYKLVQDTILFSESIYINITEVLGECDNSEKDIIWKHIAVIYAYFKPNAHIKNMLIEKKSNESNFIKDMIDKVENSIDGGNVTNPMEAITKMMTSGVFSELVGNMTNGLQSGDLNIGNLLGSVNDMVGTMNTDNSDNNEPNKSNNEPNKSNNESDKDRPRKKNRNKKNKKLRRK